MITTSFSSYTISKKWVLQAVLFVDTHHPWHMLARSIYQEFVVYPLPGSMLLSPNVSSWPVMLMPVELRWGPRDKPWDEGDEFSHMNFWLIFHGILNVCNYTRSSHESYMVGIHYMRGFKFRHWKTRIVAASLGNSTLRMCRCCIWDVSKVRFKWSFPVVKRW